MRTWEFSAGLRSVPPIYFLAGPGFSLMKEVPQIMTSYWAIVLPRLSACILSLAVDVALLYICNMFAIDSTVALPILASSYVMLTYLTRPFSNTLETVTFCVLLVLVAKVVKNIHHSQSDRAEKKSKEFEELPNDGYQRKTLDEFRKKHSLNPTEEKTNTDSNGRTVFLIGVVMSIGMFIRPTFAAFSVSPILWLVGTALMSGDGAVSYLFLMGFGAMVPSTLMVLVDTAYYKNMTILDILSRFRQCVITSGNVPECWEEYFSMFIVTPWNFLKYNSDPDNLSDHGHHPYYTHLLINIPLLLGPAVVLILAELYRFCTRRSTFYNSTTLWFLTPPILILSLIPHQEPRFLLPLLPLGVILCASSINRIKHRNLFLFIWCLFNLIGLLFFGCFHQGGVTPLLSYIEKNLHNSSPLFTNEDTFFFFHTYMPPRSLLLSATSVEQVVDLQGSPIDDLVSAVKSQKTCCSYLAIPGTMMEEFMQQRISFDVIQTFPFHLSMEDPPPYAAVKEVWQNVSDRSYYDKLFESMSLFLLKLKS